MSTLPVDLASLWLTDRSRWKLGISRCPRARYLSNHFGPSGYGITRSAQAIPLATGAYTHDGQADFCRILRDHDRLPTLEETRSIVQTQTGLYDTLCTKRGFRGILAGEATDETILEQKTLIAGLLWALRIHFLPWLIQRYRVVEVEEERLHYLDQTHALMIRTDLLCESRSGSSLAYFETKTTGWGSSAWVEQWETDPQMGLGTLDLEQKYGKEVSELYVVVLQKGARKKDFGESDSPDARRKQQSSLCYGYCRPGNPPLLPDDWLPSYEYYSDEGEKKRASRAHKRRGVWTLKDSDWPLWELYRQSDPGLSAEECWVRLLPKSILENVCAVLGPMNRQDHQLQAVRRSLLAEEQRWEERSWALYDLQQAGESFGSEIFQAALDRIAPCSWNCRPFGKEAQCEFVPICHRESGWQDPLGMEKYRLRRPHHDPELQQAQGRGLLVEEAQAGEEEE